MIVLLPMLVAIVLAVGNGAGWWAVPALVVWLLMAPMAFSLLLLGIGLAVVLRELAKDDAATFATALDRAKARTK